MMKLSKYILAFVLVASSALGAGIEWIDGGRGAIYQATLDRGDIWVPTEDPKKIDDLIRRQLYYSVGQLNAIASGPALDHSLKISQREITASTDGYFHIVYQAEFLIAWNHREEPPEVLSLIFPTASDVKTTINLHEIYVKTCGLPYEEGPETFYFYFRPELPECLIDLEDPQGNWLVMDIELSPSSATPTASRPNYAEVWKDGELVVTTVFGKLDEGFESGATHLIRELKAQLGEPSLWLQKEIGYFTYTRAKFATRRGPLDIRIFDLKDKDLASASEALLRLLKLSSARSDYLSYNGHSGYGSKVGSFTEAVGWGDSDAYRLLYLNGCDTFTYLDTGFFGGRAPMDVITTVLSGYFAYMGSYNLTLINSLIEATDTFSSLLEQLPVGSPVILGRSRSGPGIQ